MYFTYGYCHCIPVDYCWLKPWPTPTSWQLRSPRSSAPIANVQRSSNPPPAAAAEAVFWGAPPTREPQLPWPPCSLISPPVLRFDSHQFNWNHSISCHVGRFHQSQPGDITTNSYLPGHPESLVWYWAQTITNFWAMTEMRRSKLSRVAPGSRTHNVVTPSCWSINHFNHGWLSLAKNGQ